MLFNSFIYILLFLPVVTAGFFALARISRRLAAGWLTIASLVFYGWWDPAYVALLLASISFNYHFGARLARLYASGGQGAGKGVLALAVFANLALLAYFKYTLFFLANLQRLSGHPGALPDIVLPLGISFFTFTQIAFLVDAYRGEAREYSFLHYALFVSYFPHLIAGPILHHREMMPQFARSSTYRLSWENVAVGLTMFVFGLCKKVLIADEMGTFVTPAFAAAASGTSLTLLEAWGAALCYTFQIYFDFSGYTDMALGASRVFGIVLPLNFNSPYKARSIIDFWRRWHITLSRFLRDYVYIPLGGNREGPRRRYVNLLATMLIGGLWHGAGWTFVAWGALHGGFLIVNHAWRALRQRLGVGGSSGGSVFAMLATFIVVVVGWVFFRAPDFETATGIIGGMIGHNGVVLPTQWQPTGGVMAKTFFGLGVRFGDTSYFHRVAQLNWLVVLLVFCWVAPNTQQVLAKYRPALMTPGYDEIGSGGRAAWRPDTGWLVLLAILGVAALLSIPRYSEFIYSRF